MGKEYASLRRKTFFFPFLGAATVVVLMVLLGAWWHAARIRSAPTTIVVVIREADGALSPEERSRVQALAERASAVVDGFGFDDIYSSAEPQALATIAPLLERRGGTVTRMPLMQPSAVVASILRRDWGNRVLVVSPRAMVLTLVRGLAPTVTATETSDPNSEQAYVIAVPKQGQATVLKLTLP